MILIDISNHPKSGNARKLRIDKLEIGGAAIQTLGTIMHFNDAGEHIEDFDVLVALNTLDSWVDAKTQTYVKPVGYDDKGPIFEKGVQAVPEYDLLMASDEWKAVAALLSNVMQNVDNNGGMEKKRG